MFIVTPSRLRFSITRGPVSPIPTPYPPTRILKYLCDPSQVIPDWRRLQRSCLDWRRVQRFLSSDQPISQLPDHPISHCVTLPFVRCFVKRKRLHFLESTPVHTGWSRHQDCCVPHRVERRLPSPALLE